MPITRRLEVLDAKVMTPISAVFLPRQNREMVRSEEARRNLVKSYEEMVKKVVEIRNRLAEVSRSFHPGTREHRALNRLDTQLHAFLAETNLQIDMWNFRDAPDSVKDYVSSVSRMFLPLYNSGNTPDAASRFMNAEFDEVMMLCDPKHPYSMADGRLGAQEMRAIDTRRQLELMIEKMEKVGAKDRASLEGHKIRGAFRQEAYRKMLAHAEFLGSNQEMQSLRNYRDNLFIGAAMLEMYHDVMMPLTGGAAQVVRTAMTYDDIIDSKGTFFKVSGDIVISQFTDEAAAQIAFSKERLHSVADDAIRRSKYGSVIVLPYPNIAPVADTRQARIAEIIAEREPIATKYATMASQRDAKAEELFAARYAESIAQGEFDKAHAESVEMNEIVRGPKRRISKHTAAIHELTAQRQATKLKIPDAYVDTIAEREMLVAQTQQTEVNLERAESAVRILTVSSSKAKYQIASMENALNLPLLNQVLIAEYIGLRLPGESPHDYSSPTVSDALYSDTSAIKRTASLELEIAQRYAMLDAKLESEGQKRTIARNAIIINDASLRAADLRIQLFGQEVISSMLSKEELNAQISSYSRGIATHRRERRALVTGYSERISKASELTETAAMLRRELKAARHSRNTKEEELIDLTEELAPVKRALDEKDAAIQRIRQEPAPQQPTRIDPSLTPLDRQIQKENYEKLAKWVTTWDGALEVMLDVVDMGKARGLDLRIKPDSTYNEMLEIASLIEHIRGIRAGRLDPMLHPEVIQEIEPRSEITEQRRIEMVRTNMKRINTWRANGFITRNQHEDFRAYATGAPSDTAYDNFLNILEIRNERDAAPAPGVSAPRVSPFGARMGPQARGQQAATATAP